MRRLQGLCPFHEERTPSFGIDPVEKLYHCFGCGVGGDVFRFVMETEGLDFGAALESLAERYRVVLERDTEDPRDAARRERRDRLLALLERTAAWYVRVLWESAEAEPAREYLAARGLEEGALRAFRVGWAPGAWDRVDRRVAARGLQRRGAAGGGAGAAVAGRRGAHRPLPRADHVPAGRRARAACSGSARGRCGPRTSRSTSTPPTARSSTRGGIVYGADLARAAAARAGRVVLVEGYTDVIALHQAGVPEVVGSMGTALTEAQVQAIARLAPRALFCQDPDAAGQESVARAVAGLREHNSARTTRGVEFRIVRLPAGQDPADVVQRSGADALRALLDRAVELERFEVERALERTGESQDAVLADAVGAIAPLPPSVLRDDLVRLVANRLGLGEELVNAALRGGAPVAVGVAEDGPRRPWLPEAEWRARRDRERRRGGPFRGPMEAPPPEPVDPHAALARREQSERAFLALCVALPEEGEPRLAAADVEDYFSAPATRQAAAYLRGRLRTPAADLPLGDEPLARLVAELVVRAGALEATPGKLELEALQLDLHRLERHISEARLSGTGGIGALAAERQRVLEEIRHRLT